MPRFRLRYQQTHLELPLGEFTIGRSSSCTLTISDALVSRRHASLRVGIEAVWVEDLESRNGVVVNGAVVRGACRLTHTDRIYIGHEELVLIDAAKITDQQETAPHVICVGCGAINGPSRRCCHDCGQRLDSQAGATWKEPRRSYPNDDPFDDPEETHTGETRDVVAGIASKAISMGRFDEAERMLLPHMDALLERGVRGQRLSSSPDEDPNALFATAVGYALQLAHGLRDPNWIDWVFRMHLATSRLMDAETIETLHGLVRSQDYRRRKHVRAYLLAIAARRDDYSPADQFLARRVDGLAEVILARKAV